MNQSSRGGLVHDRFDLWAPRVITLLAASAFVARLSLVFHRLYDPDELQHLHAGYCLWRGQVPYRDFFEQHQPVLWYLAQPLFAIWGDSLNVLTSGRALIWVVGGVTLGLTWYLGNRLFGRWAGPIAALLLVVHPPYQEKNVEWRPDNVALPLLLFAIVCLDRSLRGGRWLWSVLAGAAFPGSFLCTQKVAYAAVGILGAFIWIAAKNRGTRPDDAKTSVALEVTRSMLAISIGAAVVALAMLALLYQQGALGPFLQFTIVAPLQWKTNEPMLRYVIDQLASGPLIWSAGFAGWILVVCAATGQHGRERNAALIAGGAMTHTLGLLHVPAAFHQYYLPLSPLVALLAAHALTRVARPAELPVRGIVKWLAIMVGLAVFVTALELRRRMPWLSTVWIGLMAGLVVASTVLFLFRLHRAAVFVALSISAVAAAPFHMVQFLQWSNEPQARRIEQLMKATGPDDAFFDGFTGYGALRPHAFFFFWINHHSWPLVPAADKRSGVLNALADPHTRVVLLDSYLARYLGPDAIRFIEQNFEPDVTTSDLPRLIVYVRRDRPLSAEQVELVP